MKVNFWSTTAFRPTSTSIYETTCKEFLIFNWFVYWIDRLGSCLGVIATTAAQKPSHHMASHR